MFPLAHVGHWAAGSLLYLAPALGLVIWLGFVIARDKWKHRGDRDAEDFPERTPDEIMDGDP